MIAGSAALALLLISALSGKVAGLAGMPGRATGLLWWIAPALVMLVARRRTRRGWCAALGFSCWAGALSLAGDWFFGRLPGGQLDFGKLHWLFLSLAAASWCLVLWWYGVLGLVLRRQPVRWWRQPVWWLQIGFAVAFSGLCWQMIAEAKKLSVHAETVKLAGWPAKPLRIAVVADLHWQDVATDLAMGEAVVAAVNREHCDVIFLLGDYIGHGYNSRHDLAPAKLAQILARLRAPGGTYAVLGNHDYYHDPEAITAALTQVGIIVIEGACRTLEIGGVAFRLAGYPGHIVRGRLPAMVPLAESGLPSIVLSHSPDYFGFDRNRFDLMIAAHLHGGQIRIPLWGAPSVPSACGERFLARRHRRADGAQLLMTGGVGCSGVQMRLFTLPEILILNVTRRP